MIYRKYIQGVVFRFLLLLSLLIGIAFALKADYIWLTILLSIASIGLASTIIQVLTRRFVEMDVFLESIKYRDFTKAFKEDTGSEDLDSIRAEFNQVYKKIYEINAEKESQFQIRQKILELIHTGIITYNTKSGDVIWMNNSMQESLDIPLIKNIKFIQDRKPFLYQVLFENEHLKENTIELNIQDKRDKVLVSSAIFKVENENIRLILLQNIDDALNQNESEAWKKLLSVMTHEIMNSIAPIASLAETLEAKIAQHVKEKEPLEIDDLDAGIKSIKNRSEGLFKFAKTYRSLNKITKLNLENKNLQSLFQNISLLMKSSLKEKGIGFDIQLDNQDLKVEMDAHLIEQVIINLILNAADACKDKQDAQISLIGKMQNNGAIIQVADNGTGIPDEIRDRIFVPFFSTKKSGSGVGLSLSKQIMLLHHGKILINSIDGKGTVVNLVFLE